MGPRRRRSSRSAPRKDTRRRDWVPPKELEGALRSLYRTLRDGVRALGAGARAARRAATGVHRRLPEHRRVASSSTTGSPASRSSSDDEVVAHKPGKLALLRNVVDGEPLARPRTILIDSAQLESGEALKDDFKKAAAARDRGVQGRVPHAQPRRRRRQDHRRGPAARGDEHRRQAGPARRAGPLRRVASRCSPRAGTPTPSPTSSASAPSAASCCASRSSAAACAAARYAVNDDGLLRARVRRTSTASRSRSSPPTADQGPAAAASRSIEVARRRGPRATCASTFPKLDGYRVEMPDDDDLARPRRRARASRSARTRCRRWVEMRRRRRRARARARATRRSTARRRSPSRSPSASSTPTSTRVDDKRPWLFPQLVEMCQRVARAEGRRLADGYSLGSCMTITEAQAPAAEAGRGTRSSARSATAASGCGRCSTASTRSAPPATSTSTTRKAHRADREVRGHPRHARRQGRQHVGAAPRRASSSCNRNVDGVREERPPRLRDPLRPRGPQPPYVPDFLVRLVAATATDVDADADRRGLRRPEEPRPDRGQGRRPPATRGAPRSTTTAASAAGATSRSTDLLDVQDAPRRRDRGPVRATRRSSATPTCSTSRRTGRWRRRRRSRHGPDPGRRRSPTPTSGRNIPTADAHDFVDARRSRRSAGCATPATRPSTRSSSGRARTPHGSASDDLDADAPPIYIQEKIDPRVLDREPPPDRRKPARPSPS